MKVFITGCTASHASKYSNEKNSSFAGIAHSAIKELGCEIVWDSPSVKLTKEYLSQFDSVLVGVSSPTNVISHRIYGALSVIKHASELNNLSLFVDTPDPHKIYAGFREIYQNPKALVKPFYSKKREYNLALDPKNYANIIGGLNYIYTQAWPKTIIPSYPWTNADALSKYIPNVDNGKLFLVAPDAYLLEMEPPIRNSGDGEYWCVDSPKTKWSQTAVASLTMTVTNYRTSKWDTNKNVLERLTGSVGALISTYKDGNAWWMPTLSQAVFVGTPTFTDWRHTSYMGLEWSALPASIESMSADERAEFSRKQRQSYLQNLPSWEKVKENLGNVLLQKTYA